MSVQCYLSVTTHRKKVSNFPFIVGESNFHFIHTIDYTTHTFLNSFVSSIFTKWGCNKALQWLHVCSGGMVFILNPFKCNYLCGLSSIAWHKGKRLHCWQTMTQQVKYISSRLDEALKKHCGTLSVSGRYTPGIPRHSWSVAGITQHTIWFRSSATNLSCQS